MYLSRHGCNVRNGRFLNKAIAELLLWDSFTIVSLLVDSYFEFCKRSSKTPSSVIITFTTVFSVFTFCMLIFAYSSYAARDLYEHNKVNFNLLTRNGH